MKQRIIHQLTVRAARLGRRYSVKWDALDIESLLDIERMFQDMELDAQVKLNQAQRVTGRTIMQALTRGR